MKQIIRIGEQQTVFRLAGFLLVGGFMLTLISLLGPGIAWAANSSGLITHWRFDEPTAGSTIIDSSGSGFNGTPLGVNQSSNDNSYIPQPSTDVPPTTFPDPYSLFFKGDGGNSTGSYVNVNDWNVDTSNGFTVSLWAKPTTTPGSGWERFFDFGNGAGSDNVVFAQYADTSSVYFEVYDGSSTTKIIAPPGSWDTGHWHLYSATIDAAGNATIYIDGIAVVTGTTNKPVNIVRSNKYIGRSNWADDYYQGYMDDFRFYDRALTPAEVVDLADGNSGPGVPTSTASTDPDATTSPSTSTAVTAVRPTTPDTGYGTPIHTDPIVTVLAVGAIVSISTGLVLLYTQKGL